MNTRAAEVQTMIRGLIPFYEHFDLRVESLGETLRVSIPLNAGSRNHFGGMHAAVQFAAAEALGGLVFSLLGLDLSGYWGAVREVTIRYKQRALSDVRAEARISEAQLAEAKTQLDANGKADFVLEAQVLNTEGAVVATTTATYHVRRRDPGGA